MYFLIYWPSASKKTVCFGVIKIEIHWRKLFRVLVIVACERLFGRAKCSDRSGFADVAILDGVQMNNFEHPTFPIKAMPLIYCSRFLKKLSNLAMEEAGCGSLAYRWNGCSHEDAAQDLRVVRSVFS